MALTTEPVSKAEILIRKSVAEVFQAFTDPAHITKFWFDKSSGALAEGVQVKWHWTMYNLAIPVKVDEFIENEKIVMTWGDEEKSKLEWTFAARSEESTYVSLLNSGFAGTDDEKVAKALDSKGGFNLVLAAAKAYLEHGIQLNVVADRF